MAYELQDFGKDVVEASNAVPVVIDFWAEWCGPCRQLGPILEKLAKEAKGRWKLVKVDTDKNPDLAVQFNVRGIPAVKMVYQGQVVAEFTGAQPEHMIKQWLKEHLPKSEEGESDEISSRVNELLAGGEREQAASLLAKRINGEAESGDYIRYAMLLLPEKIDKAEELMERAEQERKYEIEFETLATIKHLERIAAGKIKPESDNERARELYIKGAKALFSKDFDEALQHFIQCVQLDRQMDDDGARKACIACFTMLSQYHPLTIKYRRRFSMSLY